MHIVISISVITACLVISLTCGIVLLLKRREVPDRSRLFLAVFNLVTALLCTLRLFTFIANPALKPYHEVMAPFLLTGGMTAMMLYLAYPIEVINPGWLNWRRGLLLALPALIALALPLCGVHYQHLTALSDIRTHITDFDVLARLAMVVCACQVIDDWEAWRNPNTSVETIRTAVGTNRIYVARCVKEHTGLTVNDYINRKRVDFMAAQLSKTANPVHKEIYFAAGYRSRQTAYRNFLKFKGVSPTEFVTASIKG